MQLREKGQSSCRRPRKPVFAGDRRDLSIAFGMEATSALPRFPFYGPVWLCNNMKARASLSSFSTSRFPSLSQRLTPTYKPLQHFPAPKQSTRPPSVSLHHHSLTGPIHSLPTERARLPPLAMLPPTTASRKSERIPRLQKRFGNMGEVLSRIPCEDFISSLLNREPFAANALVVNLVKIRKRTSWPEPLTEDSDEETDTD